MPAVRYQLTLFVPEHPAIEIEAVRRRLDPVQFALIAAHVTLCREDEFDLQDPDGLLARAATAPPLSLTFGTAERFLGHGMQLPCIDGAEAFHALRCRMLASDAVRRAAPHITLAHPRNPRSPDNAEGVVAALPATITLTFSEVALIRQTASSPWDVVRRFPLTGPVDPGPRPERSASPPSA